MRTFLVVFLGSGFGAACRHGVNTAFARWLGAVFPFYTLFENLSGSFLMGVVDFAFKGDASQHLRLFLTTGAFSLDAALLWERHQVTRALLYNRTLSIRIARRLVAWARP
jgi:CrcB protein